MTATADILDEHGDRASVCAVAFRQFGGRPAFEGPISTVRCDEDNVVMRRRLSEPGNGGVLVVDGGGSRRVALAGEMVASLARDNGWAGLVINGCVRDAAALRELDVGIKAIGTTPRASGKAGTRRDRCAGDVRRRHVPPRRHAVQRRGRCRDARRDA